MRYPNLTMVSPDAGGAERARAYAKRLDAELAIVDKRRTEDGTAEVMNVIGDVRGRTCILQDDIIDTAGTIQKAATALKDSGRRARAGVRGARRAVGPGDRAHREGAARSADRHQLDPAERGGAEVQEDRRAVGGAAAGAGDSQHSRGDVGLVAVRVTGHTTRDDMEATLEAVKRTDRGKNEARRLRAAGSLPAVVYGAQHGRRGAGGRAGVGRSEGADADPALGFGRQHADQAEASMAPRRRCW